MVSGIESVAELAIDPRLCTACRACEVACSLHLTGQHNPAASAIQVCMDRESGSLEFSIQESCDRCDGEEMGALCIEVCQPGALLWTPTPSGPDTLAKGSA